MYNLNRVIMAGNLTRDPEAVFTKNGTCKATLALAINRKYKDSQGKLAEDVTYVNAIAWGKLAENAHEYLKKGRPVLIEGRLTVDKFDGKDGERVTYTYVTATSIQFGPRKQSADEPTDEEAQAEADDNPFA